MHYGSRNPPIGTVKMTLTLELCFLQPTVCLSRTRGQFMGTFMGKFVCQFFGEATAFWVMTVADCPLTLAVD